MQLYWVLNITRSALKFTQYYWVCVYVSVCMCLCVCVYVSVSVCVCVCARFKERTSVGVCVCLNLSGRFACSVDYMSLHISRTRKCMTCFHPSVRLFPLLSFAYVNSHWMWAHFGIYLCTCRRTHIRLSPDLSQPIRS